MAIHYWNGYGISCMTADGRKGNAQCSTDWYTVTCEKCQQHHSPSPAMTDAQKIKPKVSDEMRELVMQFGEAYSPTAKFRNEENLQRFAPAHCAARDALLTAIAALEQDRQRYKETLEELNAEYNSTEPEKYRWSITRIFFALNPPMLTSPDTTMSDKIQHEPGCMWHAGEECTHSCSAPLSDDALQYCRGIPATYDLPEDVESCYYDLLDEVDRFRALSRRSPSDGETVGRSTDPDSQATWATIDAAADRAPLTAKEQSVSTLGEIPEDVTVSRDILQRLDRYAHHCFIDGHQDSDFDKEHDTAEAKANLFIAIGKQKRIDAFTINSLRHRAEQAERKVGALELENARLLTALEEKEQQLAVSQNKVAGLYRHLVSLQKTCDRWQFDYSRAANSVDVLAGKLEALQDATAHQKEELEQARSRIEVCEGHMDNLERALTEGMYAEQTAADRREEELRYAFQVGWTDGNLTHESADEDIERERDWKQYLSLITAHSGASSDHSARSSLGERKGNE